MTFRRYRLLLLPISLAALCAVVMAADWWFCAPPGQQASYVGRQSCVECHSDKVHSWTGSDHDLAMDRATSETVLGDFNDREFTHFDLTSRLFRRGNQFFIRTEGAKKGELEDFEITHTFGVRPLQQYLVSFPDGRKQVLSIAWDTEKKQWFDLHPEERIRPGDELHWTGRLQNWNYMCAECHSTELQKNYHLETDSYDTKFAEIDVSCEACHGPGSLHLELAGNKSPVLSRRMIWDRNYGYGLANLKGKGPKDARGELEACARCHARRGIVYPDYHPGRAFLDHYSPQLLDGDLYYADGQIRDEVFDYGSFLQSRMYREGVRCTDCHDAHTTRIKAQGNNLCVRCHVAGKYDTPLHHHHAPGKQGANCVDCHMPETTYMVVDPRRDHSLRIPRPDLTWHFGQERTGQDCLDCHADRKEDLLTIVGNSLAPNSCNGCHANKTAAWASRAVNGWFGPKRKDDPHYALAIAAGRDGRPEGEKLLTALAKRPNVGPIVQASAVALLGRYTSDASLTASRDALVSTEPLVRATAVRNFDRVGPDVARRALAPLLNDPVRLVRTEAARWLTQVPIDSFNREERKQLQSALAEWETGQLVTADQPGSHLNLGVVYDNLGSSARAEAEYQTALRLDPNFAPARINLARLQNLQANALLKQGKTAEAIAKNKAAEAQYREVLKQHPAFADARYNLGLLLAERADSEGGANGSSSVAAASPLLIEAAQQLGIAAGLNPDNPRMKFNYALALWRLERKEEAEQQLQAARKMDPQSTDYLASLATLYAQLRRWGEWEKVAEELIRLQPEAKEHLQRMRREAERPGTYGPLRP